MGKRKREMAERLKEIKRQTAIAKANDVPSSPRKMRLVADTVRGVEVNHALDLLKFSKKAPSKVLETLLRSAIANWRPKTRTKLKNWTTVTSSSRLSWSMRVVHSRESVLALRVEPAESASVPTTLLLSLT